MIHRHWSALIVVTRVTRFNLKTYLHDIQEHHTLCFATVRPHLKVKRCECAGLAVCVYGAEDVLVLFRRMVEQRWQLSHLRHKTVGGTSGPLFLSVSHCESWIIRRNTSHCRKHFIITLCSFLTFVHRSNLCSAVQQKAGDHEQDVEGYKSHAE